jgi:hypothetical protein
VPVVAWISNDDDNEIYVRYGPSLKLMYVPVAAFAPCLLSPDEIEPNNRPSEAAGPLCPGRTYNGLPNDRYDIFYLEATSGRVTVELADYAATAAQLQLHHEAITASPIGLDANGADGYHIEVSNAPAGRYYIVIANAQPSGQGAPYRLTAGFAMRR